MTTPTTPGEGDINAVIVSAVNARIEAAVAGALLTEGGMGAIVASALSQEIEVKDGSSYRTKKVPYLSHVLRSTIQSAAKNAIAKMVEEHQAEIEEKVKEALTGSIDRFAAGMVESLAKTAGGGYGLRVTVNYPETDF